MLDMSSVFLNLLRLVFGLTHDLSWRIFHVRLARTFSGAIGWNGLCMSVRAIWCIVLFRFTASLLIFFLGDLCSVESGVLKSPTIIIISLFSSVHICFKYLGAPMFGTYIFTIVILLMNWLFCSDLLCLVTDFDWKSILFYVSIATPHLFLLPFARISFSISSHSAYLFP